MLGQQIYEASGKETGRRVLPSHGGPSIEISFQESGKLLGVETNNTGTYTGTARPDGTMSGQGQAIAMTKYGDVVTWVVYGMGEGHPLHEDSPLRPIQDIYAVTKAVADERVQKFIVQEHLPAVIVRPNVTFGPGDQVNFQRMADRLKAGKVVIIGSGHNVIPFVYVSDVVRGLLLAAGQDGAVGQAYNLSHDQPLSQAEIWRAIAEEIGVKPPRFHVPYSALYALALLAERAVRSNHPQRQPLVTKLGVKLFGTDNRPTTEKARRELGYAPSISIREGIRLAASWYLRQQGLRGSDFSPSGSAQ